MHKIHLEKDAVYVWCGRLKWGKAFVALPTPLKTNSDYCVHCFQAKLEYRDRDVIKKIPHEIG